MVKAQELRDQSIEELEAKMIETKEGLFQVMESFKREKKLEKSHKIRANKRDIARMLTVLREKKQEQRK